MATEINTLRKDTALTERALVAALGLAAVFSILISAAIVFVLVFESLDFFKTVSVTEFLSIGEWQPFIEPHSFSIWPLLTGTLMVAVIAAAVAFPLGLGAAIFLAEYASLSTRAMIKPTLEVLAGVPSVVFGYFALIAITPFLQRFLPGLQIFNALSAGIVIGFMTVPLVTSISDDCLSAVSHGLKEGAYALGAKKSEVIIAVCLPAAASGIIASFILAFSRAIGETMAVTLAAGSTPNLDLNPLVSIQTMTAYIVQVSLGDVPHGSVGYQSLFVVGLTLFILTFGSNIFAYKIVKKIRKRHS